MVELILSALSNVVAEFFQAFMDALFPILGFDFQLFANAFPFAQQSYYVFQDIAMGFALAISIFHITKFFLYCFGVNLGQQKSEPMQELMQCGISVFMIYYGNHIFEMIMAVAQAPFEALTNMDATQWDITNFQITDVIASSLDVFSQISALACIVIVIMICWPLLQVLIEAIERYIMVYVLIYTSPLASATLASVETKGIFWKFFSMFISQCLLMLLNVWTIKMTISLFSNIGNNASPMLALMLGYAFLRVAKRFDSYLNQLGLNAAVTGGGLIQEVIATGAVLLSGASKLNKWNKSRMESAGSEPSSSTPMPGGFGNYLKDSFQAIKNDSSVLDGVGAAMKSKPTLIDGTIAGLSQFNSNMADRGYDNKYTRQAASDKTDFLFDQIRATEPQNNSTAGTQTAANTEPPAQAPELSAASQEPVETVVPPPTDPATASTPAEPSTAPNIVPAPVPATQKKSAPSLTDLEVQRHSFFAKNAYAAHKLYSKFSSGTAKTGQLGDVSAVLEGIGGGNENAKKTFAPFIDSGYGNGIKNGMYTNVEAFMDQNGIEAMYDSGNQHHVLNVRNEAQFNAMSHDEQFGYEKFTAPVKNLNDSTPPATYYYRVDTTKIAPPVTQKTPKTPPAPAESPADKFADNAQKSNGGTKKLQGNTKESSQHNKNVRKKK